MLRCYACRGCAMVWVKSRFASMRVLKRWLRRTPDAASILIVLGLGLVACGNGGDQRPTSAPSGDFTGAVLIGKGIACSFAGREGPPSYAIRDIGNPGVPKVATRDLRTLRAMLRYVHPTTLRFAYLNIGFSVFDATSGPCSGSQYAILNASQCSAFYVPFDATGVVDFATGCNMQPRPWIPHDVGNPRGHSWKDYPNSH